MHQRTLGQFTHLPRLQNVGGDVLEGWLLCPDQSFQRRDSVAKFNLNVEDTINFIALDPAPQLDLIRHINDRGPLLLQDQQRGWSSGV